MQDQALYAVHLRSMPCGVMARVAIRVPVWAHDDVEASVRAKDELRRGVVGDVPRDGWKTVEVVLVG
jgi:hypothetical protein